MPELMVDTDKFYEECMREKSRDLDMNFSPEDEEPGNWYVSRLAQLDKCEIIDRSVLYKAHVAGFLPFMHYRAASNKLEKGYESLREQAAEEHNLAMRASKEQSLHKCIGDFPIDKIDMERQGEWEKEPFPYGPHPLKKGGPFDPDSMKKY